MSHKLSLPLAAVCIGVVGAGPLLHAQGYLDISSCFNQLLQQRGNYTSTETLSLATLALVSEATYESVKRDASMSAAFSFISATTSYSDFEEKRRNYFSLRKLDLNYFRAISTSANFLSPAAYGVITNCINQIASRSDGFHYIYTVDDAHAAAVQFFWRPNTTPGPAQIKITDSTIDNADVVAGEAFKGHLYDHSWYHWTPTVGISSPVILLRRQNPASIIRIRLVTDPQVNVGFITIPAVPKPIPPPILKMEEHSKTMTVTFEKNSLTPIARSHTNCNDCAIYEKVIAVPGDFVNASCIPVPDSKWLHSEYCGADGEHQMKWRAYTNDGNSIMITVTIRYTVKEEVCTQNCGAPN